MQHNTFQVAIATDGKISVAVFNYDEIEWIRSGDVRIGYSAGNNETTYEVDGSLTEDVGLIDSIPGNTGRNGSWIFRIDDPEADIEFNDCTG